MKWFAAAALLVVTVPATARDPLGVFGGWAAFSDPAPRRCYAIAQPVGRDRGEAFASVADWPGQNIRNQLHVRLSRSRAASARVTLSIGERRFDLVAGDSDAWAPDIRTDSAIVSAIRSGRSMSIEAMGKGGQPFADTYALGGAATAIDSATLACRR